MSSPLSARRVRGSALLASAAGRMAGAGLVVVLLWWLTLWALQ
ncbi:hypothetical protein [Castellaniella sp.]